ncbi:MAG: EF-hand domain-containing protein, partial [Candidatus Thermoplasmatota archaeon]|nr:EF-hand domain-containing protein [Candidatus Thermoplasmatota archaeon]
MSDDEQDMATCGACQAEVPANSTACPTCGVSFSGIVEENLGECGACGALVPLDSKTCSQCGVLFVHDDVVQVLSDWMDDTGLDVPTLFGRLDSDNSGSIDTDELRDGLISLQIAALPPVEVERLIAVIDQDQNGTIEIGELQNILGQGSMSFSDNVLDSVMKKSGIDDREAFVAFATSFDENENKYLDRAELKKAADAFLEREEVEVKPMERDVPQEETEEEEAEEEEAEEEDAFASALASMSEEEDDDDDADEEEVEFDPSSLIGDEHESDDTSPEEILRSLGEAIAEKGMTIRQVFESIDADLDGRINGPELQNGISEILGDNLEPSTVFEVLGVLDSDDDGSIDPMELIEAIEALELEIASDEMSDLIDSIDDDDDLEPLDEESANGIMLKIGTELNESGKNIDDLFDGFDIDSSGE